MAWVQKDPQEVVDFRVDWAAKLGSDTLESSSWSATSGVTVVTSSFGDQAAIVWVSGGTAGSTYTLTNTVVTADGRTLEQSIYLEVVEQTSTVPSAAITKADVIRLAHRKLGIVSAEQDVSADQEAYASDVLQGIWDEHSSTMNFSITAPARRYYMALADLLAAEIAPHYTAPGPDRSRAIGRLRGILLQDDRVDSRDSDDDGIVSEAEVSAAARAGYY